MLRRAIVRTDNSRAMNQQFSHSIKERRMKIGFALLPAAALLLSSAAFGESRFDGTWILNTSKSQLAGETMTYADAGTGTFKYTDSNQTYTFKPDGSSFTTPMGTERTILKNGDGSYTSTSKKGGLLLRTTTIKVSSDGKTLTEESKGTKPNGDNFDDTTTFIRTSPGAPARESRPCCSPWGASRIFPAHRPPSARSGQAPWGPTSSRPRPT